MKYLKGIGLYVILFLAILGIYAVLNGEPGPKTISYSRLVQEIKSGNVSQLIMEERRATITIKNAEDPKESVMVATIPGPYLLYENANPELQDQINNKQIEMQTPEPQNENWWSTIFTLVSVGGLLLLLWFFIMQSSQGGAGGGGRVMGFGKSKAKLADTSKNKVTFEDVAGADEEKEELEEIVMFLKAPDKFSRLGARIPKGVLLVGPPGTGKTLLAKAVSGEAGVPFYSISGSDFVEMFVGVGASRVRDLFEQAKKTLPCIVFIDEIDAVGRHRGAGLGGGHDEREQTLNQLLVEMDGFGINEGIIIMAATNRPDILDPALLRPGRFDRQIVVNYPDVKGREEILKVHSRKKPLNSNVDLSVIAKTTAGFTGADLENLLNESALLAARNNKKTIDMPEIQEAMIKVIAGPEKRSKVVSDHERKLVAYHEAGHAIISKLMPTADPVHQISIIQRGRAGGYTLSLPSEDKNYKSKKEMLDEIVILLAGRVSEKLILDDISTGASNDIERSSKIARAMVTKYGMSDKLGPLTFGSSNDEVFIGRDLAQARNYSEQVASEIDEEVRRIVDEAYHKCEELLRAHIIKLHNVANALLQFEKLESTDFELLFEQNPEISPEAIANLLGRAADKSKIKSADNNGGRDEIKPGESAKDTKTEAELKSPEE